MIAKDGSKLIDKEAIQVLKKKFIKKVSLITPNIPDAEILTGMKIRNKEDMIFAANKLLNLGAKNVLIKLQKNLYMLDKPQDFQNYRFLI